MTTEVDEAERMRSAAVKNVKVIQAARQRAESDLVVAHAALEDERRVLEILNTTGTKLASKLELEDLVQEVTDAGTQMSGATFGAFFYTAKDPAGAAFTLYTLSGAPREAFAGLGDPRATPIFKPTYDGLGVTRIANVHEDPRYGQWAPHHGIPVGHLPLCSYLAVPVALRSGEVIGGLMFGHPEPGVFTERSERLIVALASQASVAIDNARLYAEARAAAEDRKQLLEAERAARSEVERVSLMKDEFLATLSHELRTPLNSILGWADLLQERHEDADAETRRGLETISRNARAQAQLIDDLLDMSWIISGKLRLDVQRLDVAAVVDAAVDSVRPSANAKEIRIRKTLDPLGGPVFGDPHRVQQIVWNLLSNAIKFTPKLGTIDLLLQRVDSHVEISIRDSGIGIAAELLPHVFERFRQGDSSTTRRHGGLGLGLSIVRQLVELHGGAVRVESPGTGRGSTFVVELPVRAGKGQETRQPIGRHEIVREVEVQLHGVRALVVDDDDDSRELIRSVLLDAGATVVTAASADEGIAQVQATQPDVIVSDIGMPDRDGYQMMRAIRQLPLEHGRKTPAIAVTAFARSEDRTRALLAGYQVHIAKPIEAHELIVTIASLTGRTNG